MCLRLTMRYGGYGKRKMACKQWAGFAPIGADLRNCGRFFQGGASPAPTIPGWWLLLYTSPLRGWSLFLPAFLAFFFQVSHCPLNNPAIYVRLSEIIERVAWRIASLHAIHF